MTSNMAPIDTNDRWLLKLSSVSPIVSFIRVARAAQSWIFRRIPIYPIGGISTHTCSLEGETKTEEEASLEGETNQQKKASRC